MKNTLIVLITLLVSFCSYAAPEATNEVCFTPPHKQCGQVIVKHINQANENIYIQAYGFTHGAIIDSLVKASERGVKVEAILDTSNFFEGKMQYVKHLRSKGVKVYPAKITGIAHNKVMIIDGKKVITGSFNFTESADKRNSENVLIATDKALAEKYLVNWNAQKVK